MTQHTKQRILYKIYFILAYTCFAGLCVLVFILRTYIMFYTGVNNISDNDPDDGRTASGGQSELYSVRDPRGIFEYVSTTQNHRRKWTWTIKKRQHFNE